MILWENATGKRATLPLNTGAWVREIEFSPDGKIVATASELRGITSVQIWDVATGAPLMDPVEVAGEVDGLEFHPDGLQLLAWARRSDVRLIDLPPLDGDQPSWLPDAISLARGCPD